MKLQKSILIMLWILFMLLIIHNSHRIIRIVNENFSVHEQFETTEFGGNNSYSEITEFGETNPYSQTTEFGENDNSYRETTIGIDTTLYPTNDTTNVPLLTNMDTVNYQPKYIKMIALRRKYNAKGYLIIIKNSKGQKLHIVRSRHKIPKYIDIENEEIKVTFNNDEIDRISFDIIRQLYYNNIEETRVTTRGPSVTTRGPSVTTRGPSVTAENFQSEVSNYDEEQLKILLKDFIILIGKNGLDYEYREIDYTIRGLSQEVYTEVDIQGEDDNLETFFGLEEPITTQTQVQDNKCMDEEISSGNKHCVVANTLSLNKNVHKAWRDDNKCVKLGNNEPCFHCPAGTYIDYDNFNTVCSKCPYGTYSEKANSFECTPIQGQIPTTTQLFAKRPIADSPDNLQDALNRLHQRNNKKFKKFESLQARLDRCKDKFDSFREYSIR